MQDATTPGRGARGEDTAAERRRMVETLRRRGVADERVLEAFATVPRECFVPDHLAGRAYADRPLPIGHDATISQPFIVARMLELAELAPDDRVLDVGTGSGYAAALTAELVGEVVSIERVPELAERARAVLADLGHDVEVVVGDGHAGWPERAPYDAIVVAAAPTEVPEPLTEQLADGGRLVIPVGPRHATQQLVVIRREGDDLVREQSVAVRFVPLVSDE